MVLRCETDEAAWAAPELRPPYPSCSFPFPSGPFPYPCPFPFPWAAWGPFEVIGAFEGAAFHPASPSTEYSFRFSWTSSAAATEASSDTQSPRPTSTLCRSCWSLESTLAEPSFSR